MEKLPHERLREYDEESDAYIFESGSCCIVDLTENEANALADEIERYYIPQACDTEGKPWKIGDPVITSNCGETTVTGFIWDGDEWLLRCRWCGRDNEINDFARRCKRPTPKVYDADGVEIKVGDTVLSSMCGDNSFTVERISKNPKGEPLVMVEEMGSGLFPATCYHEKPVFDADNVRICKGDTVWDKDAKNPMPMKVLNFVCGEVRTDALGENSPGFKPERLTHREPDSLEKLRDDISNCNGDYVEWGSRLTALIERN